nr:hypothetical protein [uncultured Eisenbergiella sp.]
MYVYKAKRLKKRRNFSRVYLNIELFFFLCALLVNESYLYLFPRGIIYSFTQDIILLWGIFVYLKFRGDKKRRYRYKNVILLIVFAQIISIFKANLVNNEPFIYAFEETRSMFVILLYFPMKVLFDKYGIDKIVVIITKFGNFVSILLIIQRILYPEIIFLKTETGERFGHYRTYYFMALTIFTLLFNVSKLFKEKISLVTYISLSVNMIAFIFVQQTKSAIIAVLVSCIVIFILDINKGKLLNKIFFVFLSFLLIYLTKEYILLLYTEAVESINEAVLTVTGNIGVRIRLIEFILNSIKNNYLFGLGYYSGLWSQSIYITGWAYGYAMGDVGFFSYIFHVGFVGLGFSLYYLVKLTINVLEINKKSKYSSFGKMIILYFLLISGFNYYFTTNNMLLYLIIYTCIFEKKVEQENCLI